MRASDSILGASGSFWSLMVQIALESKIVPAKNATAIAHPSANIMKLPDKRRTRAATTSAATVSPKWQLQTIS